MKRKPPTPPDTIDSFFDSLDKGLDAIDKVTRPVEAPRSIPEGTEVPHYVSDGGVVIDVKETSADIILRDFLVELSSTVPLHSPGDPSNCIGCKTATILRERYGITLIPIARHDV